MKRLKETTLGSILTFQRGYDLPSSRRDEKGDYPVISSSGFTGQHSEYRCDGENIITGRYGTIGKLFFHSGKCWPLNTTLFVKDFKTNDPTYLFYLLQFAFKNLQNTSDDKSTIPGVDRNVLHQMLVPFYDDSIVQKKICFILKLIDNLIDCNKRINDNLTQMARTIFDYWFSQFDFPDKNGMPYRSSGGRMVFCEKLKRYIPLGWEMATLEDVFINVVEPTIPGSHLEGIPYTPIDQIPIRSMSFYGGLDYSQAQSSLIYYDENDIIIGAMRVYFHRVCIAAQKGITRTTTLVLRPKLEDSLSFLFELMNSDSTIEFASKMSVGTQQPYITWDNALSTFCFPKPPKEIIKKYCNEVQVTNQKVISLVKENKILNNLRNWLLPMLMNGQAIVED